MVSTRSVLGKGWLDLELIQRTLCHMYSQQLLANGLIEYLESIQDRQKREEDFREPMKCQYFIMIGEPLRVLWGRESTRLA